MAPCRVTIFNNSKRGEGKILVLPDEPSLSLPSLLRLCSEKLGIQAKRLYSERGALVDNVNQVRDNDTLYVSQGEPFSKAIAQQNSPERIINYQLAVMGPGSVGKSALTLQYVQGVFVMDYDPTIEDAYRKPVVIDDQSYMLDILDTAGQEDYIALRSTWMRERDGFLLVFSITDRSSFEGLRQFYEQLEEMHEDKQTMPPVILVGNKCDMAHDREITKAEGISLAEQFGAIQYIETSAKTGQNIDQVFVALVRQLRKRNTPVEEPPKRRSWCTLL